MPDQTQPNTMSLFRRVHIRGTTHAQCPIVVGVVEVVVAALAVVEIEVPGTNRALLCGTPRPPFSQTERLPDLDPVLTFWIVEWL